MRYDAILFALPLAAAAVYHPVPTPTEPIHLAARQTPSANGTGGNLVTACSSAFMSRVTAISSLLPPTPSALDSFYSEVYRSASATDECGSVFALMTAPWPASISSIYLSYHSSWYDRLYENDVFTTPPGCTSVYRSIADSRNSAAVSSMSSCNSVRQSRLSASATAATTGTSTGAPGNMGAAGRNGVSAPLVIGVMAVVGFVGLW
ncbi:hypothetical protein PspLS_10170 [Pyricularia sp. CBS 133598]|nr:hypothetical protein PspLS_10170 [Pyricularia sp. CBS 133598]